MPPVARRTRALNKPLPQRPVGRPTKYKPEHCDTAVALGKRGKSPSQIALALNVDRATLYDWAAASPEFATALARAKTFEQAHWEERGHKALNRQHFQANVWRTSMSARFKADYTESSQVNVSIGLEGFVSAIQERIAAPAKVIDVEPVKDDAPGATPALVGASGRRGKATD